MHWGGKSEGRGHEGGLGVGEGCKTREYTRQTQGKCMANKNYSFLLVLKRTFVVDAYIKLNICTVQLASANFACLFGACEHAMNIPLTCQIVAKRAQSTAAGAAKKPRIPQLLCYNGAEELLSSKAWRAFFIRDDKVWILRPPLDGEPQTRKIQHLRHGRMKCALWNLTNEWMKAAALVQSRGGNRHGSTRSIKKRVIPALGKCITQNNWWARFRKERFQTRKRTLSLWKRVIIVTGHITF